MSVRDSSDMILVDSRRVKPAQLLSRMLSTTCYTLEDPQGLSHDYCRRPSARQFKQIGKGQCGTVYAMTDSQMVIKVTNPGKQTQLENDHQLHIQVLNAFGTTPEEFRKDINIPWLPTWISPENDFYWQTYASKFPPETTTLPTHGIVSRKIFPLPQPIREALFDTFAPKSLDKASFFHETEHQDCLVRLYLGKREPRDPKHNFRLRNFDMRINEMEQLKLDTEKFARVIAHALAVMHWKAGIDGNDVEFVLGSAPHEIFSLSDNNSTTIQDTLQHLGQDNNSKHCSVGIWLLDFDQSKPFTRDVAGLKLLVQSFWFNDPYYPRPGSKVKNDQRLWKVFREAYLAASGRFETGPMPRDFMAVVEKRGEERSLKGSLFG